MITRDCIKDGSGILFAASLAGKRYSGQPDPLFLRGMPKNTISNLTLDFIRND
ncbi:hypothetical protein ACEN2I_14930 [Flavobacterium sp. W22_SRS_FK3]|uniref:hypothetical protein n=1 Tax=Flavobacterium sp. W22_SRS_FK3 TaxID=3240275 RepID=UPI003F900DC4